MTCRHKPGDPNCSSTRGGYADQENERQTSAELAKLRAQLKKYQDAFGSDEPPATPDSHNYEILEHQQVGLALVLKVRFPSCAKCAYEGVKVLVYEHTSVGDAVFWKVIDPHFRDPKKTRTRQEAPAPTARFPGDDGGWHDAIAYAEDVLGHRNARLKNPIQEEVTSEPPKPSVPLCGSKVEVHRERQRSIHTCRLPKGHSGEHESEFGERWEGA